MDQSQLGMSHSDLLTNWSQDLFTLKNNSNKKDPNSCLRELLGIDIYFNQDENRRIIQWTSRF